MESARMEWIVRECILKSASLIAKVDAGTMTAIIFILIRQLRHIIQRQPGPATILSWDCAIDRTANSVTMCSPSTTNKRVVTITAWESATRGTNANSDMICHHQRIDFPGWMSLAIRMDASIIGRGHVRVETLVDGRTIARLEILLKETRIEKEGIITRKVQVVCRSARVGVIWEMRVATRINVAVIIAMEVERGSNCKFVHFVSHEVEREMLQRLDDQRINDFNSGGRRSRRGGSEGFNADDILDLKRSATSALRNEGGRNMSFEREPCRRYAQGDCDMGDNCPMIHDPRHLASRCSHVSKACYDFFNGSCRFGQNCRFNHDAPQEQQDREFSKQDKPCHDYQKGNCARKFCKYVHSDDPMPERTNQPAMAPEECPEFAASGNCPRGIMCHMTHLHKWLITQQGDGATPMQQLSQQLGQVKAAPPQPREDHYIPPTAKSMAELAVAQMSTGSRTGRY